MEPCSLASQTLSKAGEGETRNHPRMAIMSVTVVGEMLFWQSSIQDDCKNLEGVQFHIQW